MLSPNQVKEIENDQSMQEEAIVEDEHVSTTPIIKGKRTKRQRPQSPVSFCLNLNPDEEGEQNTPESEESRSDICINVPDMNQNTNMAYETKEVEEEEEEEIANCLILLAQGHPRWMDVDDDYKQPAADQKKFTSKKFMETPYGDKAGYYVYECKTCFKTFPSFQALGGHRASHMKPKKEEERTNNPIPNVDTHYTQPCYNFTNNKKQRIHECSTCGAEFLSGQALGGHMRRHRATTINASSRHNHNRNDTNFPELASSLSFMSSIMANTHTTNSSAIEAKKLFLNLDLNLAAPQEDESCKIHSTTKE